MSGGDLNLPPGFRFHPTDEELVKHYLCRKCAAQPIAVPIIAEVDLYKHDPWNLPAMDPYGEKEWYFFSPRDRKYPNGSRPNRAAGSGYWKATGADKPIGVPKPVGIKKALVFYAGKAPKGEKTNWIMHEYRLADVDRSARKKNSLRLDDWVLCRIYNKKGGGADKHESLDRKSAASKNTTRPVAPPPSHLLPPKQEIIPPSYVIPQPPPQQQVLTDYMYFDTSDSIPRLHADSSCSEQVLSSTDVPCEREVQSQPTQWKMAAAAAAVAAAATTTTTTTTMTGPPEWNRPYDVRPVSGVDTMVAAPPPLFPPPLEPTAQLEPMFRDTMLHDIFMYLQKPF